MDGLLIGILLLASASALWLLLQPLLPRLAGRIGAWRVHRMLKRALPASHYSVFHDVILPTGPDNGPASLHVDHLVVSPYGVFVIACVHLGGLVSGSEDDAEWVRSRGLSKLRFRNPLRLARANVETLRHLLGLSASVFHPLAVVTGGARFTNAVPANITQPGGLVPFIQVRTRQVLEFDEARRITGLIESSRPAPGSQTAAARLATLRQTHGSRFGARQAMLGLGLITVLLGAAGSLVQQVAETPARYPTLEAAAVRSPFAEDAAPPRIELPGTVRSDQQPAAPAAAPLRAAGPVGHAAALVKPDAERADAERRQDALDARLAWESSLMCAYSAESRRCACYEPQGRKAEMDYASCRALADRGIGAIRE